jgi:hypothetical protein
MYELPDGVNRGLLNGSVDHVEYSADHSADVVVMANGDRVTVDARYCDCFAHSLARQMAEKVDFAMINWDSVREVHDELVAEAVI